MHLIADLPSSLLRRAVFAALLSTVVSSACLVGPACAQVAEAAARVPNVSVFAAASLKNALDEIGRQWKAEGRGVISVSYAASFPLARQIESGAPADVFIGADEESMDYLAERKLIAPQTRRDLLANELVLIAPLDGPDKVALTAAGVAGALGGGRLAAGDPASVPAGRYAKSAFTALGLWDGLKDRLALADSVRAALLYVSRGETPLGVVYKTDANADGKVKIVARFPDKTHDPIHYPIALTASARPGSAEFLAYLGGAEAVRVFEKQGFVVLADK